MWPSMSVPLACFLSVIRPPGISFEDGYLQLLPVDKLKCPYVRMNHDISFRLFTKHNPTTYEELFIGDDASLAASHLDFHQPTVVYFHAFLENSESGSALQVRQAYMLRGDTNVIIVNAQRLEAGPWYITAAENTWYIGNFAAQFIDYLVTRGLDLSRTHLVGHSLGGQSAGVCGSALRTGRVARITALDPALPLFNKLPPAEKLDPSDAEFVDVIHTDAGIFGMPTPVGHADFYPNAGISPQPGCELKVVVPRQLILETVFCSHWRSYQFYAESVMRPAAFPARNCADWPRYIAGMCRGGSHMGFGVDRNCTLWHTGGVTCAPLRGYYIFDLAPKNHTKQSQETQSKLDNYFGYTKIKKHKKMMNFYQEVITEIPEVTEKNTKQHTKKDLSSKIKAEMARSAQSPEHTLAKSRQKRFSIFRRQNDENDNFLYKMVEFLIKNRKNVIPVVSVMREINTLVKSSNGELSHSHKERNNYIGTPPPIPVPLTFSLELAGKDPPVRGFMKKVLGLGQTEKLTIANGAPSGLFGK